MKIVIMGLGSYKEGSGISAAKFFIQHLSVKKRKGAGFIERGDDVLITDLKTERELAHQIAELKIFCKKNKKPLPEFVLGKHRESDILNADIIVRNPGVPGDSKFLKLAKEKNIPVETDVSIFLKNCPAQIAGVTGTRGKSTTTALIYEFLKKSPTLPPPLEKGEEARRGIWLGGNIKISPLSFIDKVRPGDIVVLELSSWMLENFAEEKLAPHIAVVTNIYPDHLNTYKNMAEYIAAKKNIFARQTKEDFLVVNGENAETKKWSSPGKTVKFYKKDAKKYKTNLLGEHNLENIAAAVAVAKIFRVPSAVIKKVLKSFRGLPDRQEIIAKKKGVIYVNDTTATTPDGAIAALRAFGSSKFQVPSSKKIILICGGKDKNLEYGALAKEIKKYCKAVIFLPGSATEKIKNEMFNVQCSMFNVEAQNMSEAVNLAKKQAVKGDIVLLSPAAASFGLFNNEFDRGEQFKKAVI